MRVATGSERTSEPNRAPSFLILNTGKSAQRSHTMIEQSSGGRNRRIADLINVQSSTTISIPHLHSVVLQVCQDFLTLGTG